MKQTEHDLSNLLADIQPILHPGTYVFCTIAVNEPVPGGISPILTFREQEGTALIVTLAEAEAAALRHQFPSRMITLNAFSALDAVGFVAAITARLAHAGISVNPVSGFHHDHLFVPVHRAEDAMRLLVMPEP
jgi:uncharacterized protein